MGGSSNGFMGMGLGLLGQEAQQSAFSQQLAQANAQQQSQMSQLALAMYGVTTSATIDRDRGKDDTLTIAKIKAAVAKIKGSPNVEYDDMIRMYRWKPPKAVVTTAPNLDKLRAEVRSWIAKAKQP